MTAEQIRKQTWLLKQIRSQVWDKCRYYVETPVRDLVWRQVSIQLEGSVWNLIENEPRDLIRNQVLIAVKSQAREDNDEPR